jgi:hypothetical protein
MYLVSQVFQSALLAFSGTSQNSFSSPNKIIEDAVRSVINNIDLVESKRVAPLLPAVYSGDYLYAYPDDASVITDIIPYTGMNPFSDTIKSGGWEMDKYNDTSSVVFSTDYINGVRILRIKPGLQANDTTTQINACNSLTADGTVTATGDAGNLGLNTITFLNGNASLDFDIIPSTGSATISIASMTARDVSSITRDGVFSVGVFIPKELVGFLSSVALRIKNDTSNYISMSSAVTGYGGSFVEGFNILRFSRRTATVTGTFVETNITAIDIIMAHTAAGVVRGVKIDAITATKGVGYIIKYYSKNNFISGDTGKFIEIPASVGLIDKINVETEAYQLVVYEAQKIMDQVLNEGTAGKVYQWAERELNGIFGDYSRPGLYTMYKKRNPSDRRPNISHYT